MARFGRYGALAVLAAGALCFPAARTADAVGTLGVDAPEQVYDAVAGAATSVVAGATNYLIRQDFNGDGYPDVVNVTSRGAQVFHSVGTTGGVLGFDLVQEFEVSYSQGGDWIDFDHDHDYDLVLGDVDDLVLAVNDGTGFFTVTRPVDHGFRQPTVAKPFYSRNTLHTTGNRVRVALGASADVLGGDNLGSNPGLAPRLYVLEYSGGPAGTWSVYAQLGAFNCEGVAASDADHDGDVDLLAPNRSGVASQPFYFYEDTGSGYSLLGGFDTSAYGFAFGFGPAFADDGDLAVGSWHRVAVYPRATGFTPFTPTSALEVEVFAGGTFSGSGNATDGDFETALRVDGGALPEFVETFTEWDVTGASDVRLRAKVASGTTGLSYAQVFIYNWTTALYEPVVYSGDGTNLPGPSGIREATFALTPDHIRGDGIVLVQTEQQANDPGAWAEVYEVQLGEAVPVSYGTPTYVSLDPANAYPTGEALSQQFADMDDDGFVDLVAAGRNTPLELIHLTGDPNDLGNRFHAAPVTGSQTDLVVFDWDQDLFGMPDVLTGGSHGLWFHRNVNGGSAGTPSTPPAATAGELTLGAWYEIVDLLDPRNPDGYGDDDPTLPYPLGFYDGGREHLARSLQYLAVIDPEYLTDDTIYGADNTERVATLRTYWHALDEAIGEVGGAAFHTTDPDLDDALDAIIQDLLDAQAQIVLDAASLGGVVPKTGPRKRANKLRIAALRDRNAMQDALAGARIALDPSERERLREQAAAEGRQALDRLVRYWRVLERRS